MKRRTYCRKKTNRKLPETNDDVPPSVDRARWLRYFECEELAAVPRTADREDEILLAVVQVGDRRSCLRRRHVHGADFLTGHLVVRPQHGAALSVRCRAEAAFTGDRQRLGDQDADASLPSRLGDRDAFQRRMILDVVGRFAMSNLPDERPLVHIERGDAAVRRFDERQSLHGDVAAAFPAAASAPAAGLNRRAGFRDGWPAPPSAAATGGGLP